MIDQKQYIETMKQISRWAPNMTESELKVTMSIAEHTVGIGYDTAFISLSQLANETGLTQGAVIDGLQLATRHKYVLHVGNGKRRVKEYKINR